MGHAVAHFFANGGSQAIIVRAAHGDAAAATVTLKDAVARRTCSTLTATARASGRTASAASAWRSRRPGQRLQSGRPLPRW